METEEKRGIGWEVVERDMERGRGVKRERR